MMMRSLRRYIENLKPVRYRVGTTGLAFFAALFLALKGESWLTIALAIISGLIVLASTLRAVKETTLETSSSRDVYNDLPTVSHDDVKLPPGVKGVRKVMIATTRDIKDTEDDSELNLDNVVLQLKGGIRYGRAWVSVPEAHRLGKVERPKRDWRFLWLKKTPEDIALHFTLLDLWKLSKSSFYEEIRSAGHKSALIFVHGYNVSFANSIFKAAQIAFDTNFPGETICFNWPSRASIEAYDYDRERANVCYLAFREFLKELTKDGRIEQIYVVAHSLGSQIVMQSLDSEINLREIVFGAPDVDRDMFVAYGHVMKDAAKGLTIYASAADKALIASKIKAGGLPRAGEVPADGPLLLPGFDTIDVTALGEDMFALNHGILANDRSILDDLGRITRGAPRPPHVRSPTLQRIYVDPAKRIDVLGEVSPSEYWKVPY